MLNQVKIFAACPLLLFSISSLVAQPAPSNSVPRPNPPVIYLHYDYMELDQADAFSPAHSDSPHEESVDLLVAAFRRRGIQLVIDPHHNVIAHHQEIGLGDGSCRYRLDCIEFASLDQLRAQYFHPHGNRPWHYALFAHKVEVDGFPASGFAELPGYNFIVGVGFRLYGQCGNDFNDSCLGIEAGTFMHEFGHNLDLRHGGDEDENYKPNYFSVMNYLFQNGGIPFADTPGSTIVSGRRIDYSDRALPDLDENHLNETVGLGGSAGDRDISRYWWYDLNACQNNPYDPNCVWNFPVMIPSTGPVDWNQNGMTESDLQFDANFVEQITAGGSGLPNFMVLRGFDDWSHIQEFLRTPAFVTGTLRPRQIVP